MATTKMLAEALNAVEKSMAAVDIADKAAVRAIYVRLNEVRQANLELGARTRSYDAFTWCSNFRTAIETVAVDVRAAWSLHQAA